MAIRTIDDWCKQYRFSQSATERVHAMVQNHGVRLVSSIFEQMEREAPVGTETRIYQFGRLAVETVSEHRRQRKAEEFDKQYESSKASSEKAHAEGYRPTPEKLRSQLEEMYEQGEISFHEYEWGLKGLATVFDLVDAAQSEPDAEMGDVPF